MKQTKNSTVRNIPATNILGRLSTDLDSCGGGATATTDSGGARIVVAVGDKITCDGGGENGSGTRNNATPTATPTDATTTTTTNHNNADVTGTWPTAGTPPWMGWGVPEGGSRNPEGTTCLRTWSHGIVFIILLLTMYGS